MERVRSIGLPAMHKERGERRAFLPSFVKRLSDLDVDVVLEHGYGERLGFSETDYCLANPRTKFGSREEVYGQDVIVVLRAPEFEDLKRMQKGAFLFSMLHYDTRPALVKVLADAGIQSFSLDSIADDSGSRLVVTYELTAGGGVREAFRQAENRWPDFYCANRRPTFVTILGMGHLGVQAGKASFAMGDPSIKSKAEQHGVRGVIVTYLERDVTKHPSEVNRVIAETDILIDATRRADPTEFVIRNAQVGYLPEHAIILDLTADPYDTRTKPIQVKAIEGIPTGTLDQYVFEPDDPVYDSIPAEVDSKHRRVVVSCNAWPGVSPIECMQVYEEQLLPMISLVCLKGGVEERSADPLERALYRSTLDYFLKVHTERRCEAPELKGSRIELGNCITT